jgi:hypothetical protein
MYVIQEVGPTDSRSHRERTVYFTIEKGQEPLLGGHWFSEAVKKN